jgi:hypothetical protein
LGGDDLAGYSVGGVAVQTLGFSDAEDLERAEAKGRRHEGQAGTADSPQLTHGGRLGLAACDLVM